MLPVSWSQMKSFIEARSLSAQFVEFDVSYLILGIDGPFTIWCEIDKTDPKNDNQTDFEDNFKSSGNKTPTTRLPPFAEASGFRHRAKGFSGTATAGQATNIQYKLTEERVINGIGLVLKNHVIGDTVDFEVVDVDYEYAGTLYPADFNGTAWNIAAPTGVVLDRFGESWNIAEDDQKQGPYVQPYYARIYTGLYLRIIYHSTGQNNVSVGVNAFLHKKT